jgi:hypothetical protein
MQKSFCRIASSVLEGIEMNSAVALIVMGGLIVLGTLAAAAIRHDRDHARLAELYRDKGTAMVVASELRSVVITFSELSGLGIGFVLTLVGAVYSRKSAIAVAEQTAATKSGA